MKHGVFIFNDKKLILNEGDLITLLKATKSRNRVLHRKFSRFFAEILEDEEKSFYEEVINNLL